MAKKTTHQEPVSRALNIEDLEQIVGGAAATHQQYDSAQQNILGEINNSDIANAIAADATSIASNPTNAANISAAIANIESHATTDHVSEIAALAALDAATYGNAKIGGNDAIAAELTKVLTSGSGEADMAQLAMTNSIDPATLVAQLDHAVQILALGSANQNTALGFSTTAATDWVEAKLETAASAQVVSHTVAVASDAAMVASDAIHETLGVSGAAAQLQMDTTKLQADETALTGATALQSYLAVQHQGEVTEGTEINTLMTALGSNSTTLQQDAAALSGLSGTALQNEITAAEHVTGLPSDVTLVALDLFSQGNAAVQQDLSHDFTSGSLESQLASAVATGAITGDLAVQALNLIVADLAQNSVNAGTVPALEEAFAAANADALLAADATSLAAVDTAAAVAAASGYTPNAALETHQAQLAAGLATLINTTYSSEIALATEISTLKSELGSYATTIINEASGLTAGNKSLAEQYIAQIESKAAAAEAGATPGSTQGVFSADAALALLAIYSNGNQTVLGEIEARLVNGTAEQDLVNLVALGAIPASQAVTTLTTLVDTLAANSPSNSVSLTGTDGGAITLDRTSAEDWALGQFAKYALPMLSNADTAMEGLAAAMGQLNGAGTATESKALGIALAEAGYIVQLVALLENDDAQRVVAGLGIDTAWTSAGASADAAALIAAGTSTVQTNYGPEQQVSASATAAANAVLQAADERELANFDLVQEIMEANLAQVWSQNIGSGQDAAVAAVQADAKNFYQSFLVPVTSAALDEWGFTSVYQSGQEFSDDPNLQNFVNLALNIGMLKEGPLPQWANGVDLGLQGMAALLQESAVSDVIGTHASGDLATACQVLHDALSGTMNLFNDAVLLYGQTGVTLAYDALQVSENAITFSSDLFHGNFGALGGDATTLFENLGHGLADAYAAYYGWRNLWLPVGAIGDMATDIAQALGGIETDLMSNQDFASAVGAIESEAQSLISDIGDILPSSVDSVISSVFSTGEKFLSDGLHEGESIVHEIFSWL